MLLPAALWRETRDVAVTFTVEGTADAALSCCTKNLAVDCCLTIF
jgi:hypothetical protein